MHRETYTMKWHTHSYTQAKNLQPVMYSRVVQRPYAVADRKLTMDCLCTVIPLVRQNNRHHHILNVTHVHASRHVAAQRNMYCIHCGQSVKSQSQTFKQKCGKANFLNSLYTLFIWVQTGAGRSTALQHLLSQCWAASLLSHRKGISFQAEENHIRSLWGCDATAACGGTGSEFTRLF